MADSCRFYVPQGVAFEGFFELLMVILNIKTVIKVSTLSLPLFVLVMEGFVLAESLMKPTYSELRCWRICTMSRKPGTTLPANSWLIRSLLKPWTACLSSQFQFNRDSVISSAIMVRTRDSLSKTTDKNHQVLRRFPMRDEHGRFLLVPCTTKEFNLKLFLAVDGHRYRLLESLSSS